MRDIMWLYLSVRRRSTSVSNRIKISFDFRVFQFERVKKKRIDRAVSPVQSTRRILCALKMFDWVYQGVWNNAFYYVKNHVTHCSVKKKKFEFDVDSKRAKMNKCQFVCVIVCIIMSVPMMCNRFLQISAIATDHQWLRVLFVTNECVCFKRFNNRSQRGCAGRSENAP